MARFASINRKTGVQSSPPVRTRPHRRNPCFLPRSRVRASSGGSLCEAEAALRDRQRSRQGRSPSQAYAFPQVYGSIFGWFIPTVETHRRVRGACARFGTGPGSAPGRHRCKSVLSVPWGSRLVVDGEIYDIYQTGATPDRLTSSIESVDFFHLPERDLDKSFPFAPSTLTIHNSQ